MIHHWLIAHVRAFRSAIHAFVRAPLTNAMTILVIAIAIALPLGFFVLLKNIEVVSHAQQTNAPSISLYLQVSATQNDIDTLIKNLNQDNRVQKITYISSEQGLKSFEKKTMFHNVSAFLSNNPIPAVVIVYPNAANRNTVAMNTLYASLKTLPLVDTAQLDAQWITRLNNIVHLGNELSKALSILFACSILLIVGHALRESLSYHTTDIQIFRLLGATSGYIRRPLLYQGWLYGLCGALGAAALVQLLLWTMQDSIAQLAQSYQTHFQLIMISRVDIIALTLVASLLGWLGAWMIAVRFINRSELSR